MKNFIGAVQNKNKGSLCYYMKNIKANSAQMTKSPFVLSDKQGKVLKHSKDVNCATFYVPIGNLEGVYRFVRPLMIASNHASLEKARINFNKLNDLAERRETGRVEIQIVESEDEEDEYNDLEMEDFERKNDKEPDQDEDEESS